MSKYGKILKYVLWVMMIIGAIIAIWAYAVSFTEGAVDTLLYFAYVMVAIGVGVIILVGITISALNNPKNLIKLGIGLVAAVIVIGAVYMLSPGNPAMGYIGQEVSHGTLKMTDTLLNLTYILCALAVITIIYSAIASAIRSNK